jgi:hypothetical protein
MADIHESESSSLNDSSSASQVVERDDRRYDYILTNRVLEVSYSMIRYINPLKLELI